MEQLYAVTVLPIATIDVNFSGDLILSFIQHHRVNSAKK